MIATILRELIAEAAGVSPEAVGLEHPEAEEHGDYSTNVAMAMFAKEKGKMQKAKSPRELAEEIAKKFEILNLKFEIIDRVEVAGPGFINIWLRKDYLISQLERVTEIQNGKAGKTAVVDYSAPNIAKPFGIGHLRSTIIGQALVNIYKYLGYEVIGDNHLGDWGTQFGKLLFMIDREGEADLSIENLERMYVEFHQHPEWEEEGRKWFKKLEEGDIQARKTWTDIVEISMNEFNRIYDLVGVKIDVALGESFYEDKMGKVIDEAKEKGIATKSDGAWVIEISGMKTPLMLIKSDGATTYATRDLATLKYRKEKWDPHTVIYEVGAEQELHFKQVFAAARMLGYVSDSTVLMHTKHGLYLDEDGKKFATRKGKTVKLEGILLEAIDRAKKLGSEDEETARAVGIGAIKYHDLKHGVQSDIVFNWEKMFELEGNSGPYLQYTYARTQSVLRKSGRAGEWKSGRGYEPNFEEMAILRYIYRFPEVVEEAAQRYSPNLICNFLFELAQRFNSFYNRHSILGTGEAEGGEVLSGTRQFRLLLTGAVGKVLKEGLEMLGIEALERM